MLEDRLNNNSPELDKKLRDYYEKYRLMRNNAKRHAEENPSNLYDESVYDFYFNKLPEFSLGLRKILNKIERGSYTKFYQLIG
ncbi:hypothetical protein, partial [Flavonifractor plautii]|uniref:hypothetical protein n=1 Tax=Flavonifractor plautii TaxID=292800 RepID=UPI003D7D98DE